jgi:hypothetical protein
VRPKISADGRAGAQSYLTRRYPQNMSTEDLINIGLLLLILVAYTLGFKACTAARKHYQFWIGYSAAWVALAVKLLWFTK